MTEIEKIKNCKELIIYGAGGIASDLVPSMKKEKGINITSVSISKTPKPGENLDGIIVVNIETLLDYKDSATVFVAVSEKWHEEILDNLLRLGFKNFILCTEALRDETYGFFVRRHLSRLGAETEKEIMNIGGLLIMSPEYMKNHYPGVSHLNSVFIYLINFIAPALLKGYEPLDTAEGPYEFEGVRVCEGDVVFDCGANLGVFSAYAAMRKAFVHAFEPLTDYHSIIEKNTRLNGGEVKLSSQILMDYSGETEFVRCDAHYQSSIFLKGKRGKTERLNCVSLDDYVKKENIRKVDFIKADIEGAERFMLKGAVDTLREMAPKLAICAYHIADDEDVIEQIILDANPAYKIAHKWGKIYAWVEK